MTERTIAGANYIITFFNEIQQLNQTFSHYLNLVVELKSKYGADLEDVNIDDLEKRQLQELAQLLRSAVTKSYILYTSIYSVADELTAKKDVFELYVSIRNEYIMKLDEAEKYVILMNQSLTKDIVNDLIVNAKTIIGQIYGNK